jgi:hypothetical protein
MPFLGKQPVRGLVGTADIDADVVNSQHYAAGSVDLEHMSSQSVDEDNLHISNSGSNGQFLSKQSGNAGGLTWAAAGGAWVPVSLDVLGSAGAVGASITVGQTYRRYRIDAGQLRHTTTNLPHRCRWSNDGGTTWTDQQYGNVREIEDDGGEVGTNWTSGAEYASLWYQMYNGVNSGGHFTMHIATDASDGQDSIVYWWIGANSGPSGTPRRTMLGSSFVQASDYFTTVEFSVSSGTIRAGAWYALSGLSEGLE